MQTLYRLIKQKRYKTAEIRLQYIRPIGTDIVSQHMLCELIELCLEQSNNALAKELAQDLMLNICEKFERPAKLKTLLSR